MLFGRNNKRSGDWWHDTYPVSKPIPNEKVLFRDLPQYVSNNAILEFLNDQPGIHVKSGIIFSRLRDSENKLTPYCSGDRFVYVRGNMSQAIQSSTINVVYGTNLRKQHAQDAEKLITPPQTPIGVMHLKKTMMQSSSDLRHT